MTSEMTSRERVQATVRGEPVDRVPVMTWLNPHAGLRLMAEFQPASNRLAQYLGKWLWKNFKNENGFFSEDVRAFLPIFYWGYVNQGYALDCGSDLVSVGLGITKVADKIWREDGRLRVRDAFGSIRGMGSVFLDVIRPAVGSIEDLVNLELPDASEKKRYDKIRKFRAKHPGACLYGESFGVQDLPSTQLWDMSAFMLALYDSPDEVKAFQARFNDYNIDVSRRMIEAGADVILIYDDYGTTGSPLTSLAMWKEFSYPHLKKHIEAIHDAGGLAMLHSCGLQTPFLDYYVEAELDILQSFQPGAGNDFAEAYGRLGDRLTFSTGIDVQQGERMTPDELRDDILRAYRIGGRNGRHILGYSHMLQYTMPAENIAMLLETVRNIQEGRYDD
jgi:uroporphyrinogen-III decarboxylase